MKKHFTSIILIFSMVMCMLTPSIVVKAAELEGEQKQTEELLASICIENWEEYGVLPSVCLAQAFIESTMGKFCSGNNLWGIASGAVSYSSLEEGTIGYLQVINNGYYPNAPFNTDYHEQIKAILAGGYCEGDSNYYENAVWVIETYEYYKYDEQLFQYLKEKKESDFINGIAEEEGIKVEEIPSAICKNSDSLDNYSIEISPKVTTTGSIALYVDGEFYGYFTVVINFDLDENTIVINDKTLEGKKVYMQLLQDSIG